MRHGLVLLPTRELASQVRDVLLPLARAMGLSVTAVFGGTAQRSQVTALRNRADIVVACPGRLADLIEQGHCRLSMNRSWWAMSATIPPAVSWAWRFEPGTIPQSSL